VTSRIAVVGMACEYPDARSPQQLWENALAQRQAFRPMPRERLRIDDYPANDARLGLAGYPGSVAVIEGYTFERQRFVIGAPVFHTVDPVHWLALDCADRALRDAGFDGGRSLPSDTTGVLFGNTLTGDYSRAAALQTRWPYIRSCIADGLAASGIRPAEHANVLSAIEQTFLGPLPDLNAESLAGWMSNTIAGRICNYFNLKGGGYVVDGACASSLLAVANACSALAAGDLDVAIAGGVDLSLDPFELVGFARAGALATTDMRPYDHRAMGFWPGEGCGVVVLMREPDALAQGRRIYARLLGWGISSDGQGGITRPEPDGQLFAIRRAYQRAGLSISTVPLFEGHGTGTTAGDEVEIKALATALAEAGAVTGQAVIGSVKANIGHTKAAAGVAGLIKSIMAVGARVLPPATACETPRPPLDGGCPLRIARVPEPWPSEAPARAAVSAMGFGGINVHVVLEEAARTELPKGAPCPAIQDAELLPVAADDRVGLIRQLEAICGWLGPASRSELTDLAVYCQRTLRDAPVRTALVARTPSEMIANGKRLIDRLARAADGHDVPAHGVHFGEHESGRIGLLFSGQASPVRYDPGAWGRRFSRVHDFYSSETCAAMSPQEAIARASLAATLVLAESGIAGDIAIGHSLGEYAALRWAEVADDADVLSLVRARAGLMARCEEGMMAAVSADAASVHALIAGMPVVTACLNGPRQTVVAGRTGDVEALLASARAGGIAATRVNVGQAFHSPAMAPAATGFADVLASYHFRPPARPVYSTISGCLIGKGDDIRALLRQQLTSPVRFHECVSASGPVALWIECGPGEVLATLMREQFGVPVVSVDAASPSLANWLEAIAAAYVRGARINWGFVSAGRFSRPVDLSRPRRFLKNPCAMPAGREQAVDPRKASSFVSPPFAAPIAPVVRPHAGVSWPTQDPLTIARQLVADRAELPLESVQPEHHLLRDLHLNSMTVGTLAVDLARILAVAPPTVQGSLADATLTELVDIVAAQNGLDIRSDLPGIAPWVRPFRRGARPVSARPRTEPRRRRNPRETVAFGPADHPLRAPAIEAVRRSGGGVVLCAAPDADATALLPLLSAARDIARLQEPTLVVVAQIDGSGRGLARTLAAEVNHHDILLVRLASDRGDALRVLDEEVAAVSGFREVEISPAGERLAATFAPLSIPSTTRQLGPRDLVLVSGGGSGITAECALALARDTGCALGLIGRSPREAPLVQATLERCGAFNVRARYESADLLDASGVRAAVDRVERDLGRVTAIVHGAAINTPRLLADVDDDLFLATVATKVDGARHLLGAVDRRGLRIFVAFGSIIAHTGLAGEAHYAVANERLTSFVLRTADELPDCRCLTLHWSIWSGTGMGERLGRVAALERQGIAPITLDQGVDLFVRLVGHSRASGEIIASSRMGSALSDWCSDDEMPATARFLEHVRVHVPGVELIAEADLSGPTDPYLYDHRLNGTSIFPGVMALETFAQYAQALLPRSDPSFFEFRDVAFDVALSVEPGGWTKIRVAALSDDEGVRLVLRSSSTAFTVDHVRATFVRRPATAPPREIPPATSPDERTRIDAADFYGSLFFQGPRFRRVHRYAQLHARRIVACLEPDLRQPWFGPYLPQTLLLPDPGRRDATLHAIQAAIPEWRLVPVGVDQLWIRAKPVEGVSVVTAVERAHEGKTFVYDVTVTDTSGLVCESWTGLRLQTIGKIACAEGWPIASIGPMIERDLPVESGVHLIVAECRDRSGDGRDLIARLLGQPVYQRVDGRPETPTWHVSASHANGIGLAAKAALPVACDVEPVVSRLRETWRDLLGCHSFTLSERLGDRAGLDSAATRLWCARECIRKLGLPSSGMFSIESCSDDRATLRCGDVSVLTRRIDVRTIGTVIVAAATLSGPRADLPVAHAVNHEVVS
jgi:enediyne polyketide synthase